MWMQNSSKKTCESLDIFPQEWHVIKFIVDHNHELNTSIVKRIRHFDYTNNAYYGT